MSFLRQILYVGVSVGIWAAPPTVAAGNSRDGGPIESSESSTQTLPSGFDEELKSRMLSWSTPKPKSAVNSVEVPFNQAMDQGERLRISSSFGWRNDPFRGIYRRHSGIDLPGFRGARVMATAPGIVTIAGWVHGYGNLVEIMHGNGIRTRYGHLAGVYVAAGEHVRQGQLIGGMGSTGRSTGTHLHYEVRVNGNAVDPLQFIGRPNSTFSTVWGDELHAHPRWLGWAEMRSRNDTLPESEIR